MQVGAGGLIRHLKPNKGIRRNRPELRDFGRQRANLCPE